MTENINNEVMLNEISKPTETTEVATEVATVVETVIDETAIEPSKELKDFANTVYDEFRGMVESLNLNVTNFILIVTKCIERVDKFTKMSGQDKYIVVMLVLNKVVDDVMTVDANDKYYLHNMIPSLIEIVIETSKGRLNLNLKHIKRTRQVDVKQIIDDLYSQIKDIIKEDNYSAEYICTNVVIIVGMLMSAVEKYPDVTGMEKKAIVIRVIDKLIDELYTIFPKMDSSLKLLIEHAKLMLPDVIDMLVSISRKHFDINIKKCKAKFASIFSCCCKKK